MDNSSHAEIPRIATSSYGGPIEIIVKAPHSLFRDRTALILNSRQSKTPCGRDDWVKQTIEAIKFAGSSGYTILTSVGITTWELQIYICSAYRFRQIIVCPVAATENQDKIISLLIDDFKLRPEEVGFAFFQKRRSRSPKSNWPIRDESLFRLADLIIPVSVRSGGNLDRLLDSVAGKEIIDGYRIPYRPLGKTSGESAHIIENDIRPISNWDHVAHWTHTFHSAWPNQKRFDYYRRITESESYPATAFHTLCNILESKIIYGSERNQNERRKAVAFSNLPPQEMLPLMTWRNRYNRLNFEPFAIAIKRKAASRTGIRPVIYGPHTLYRRLSTSDQPYFQNQGSAGGNWKPEHEWRFLGDLNLADFESEELLVITATAEQAEFIGSRFGLHAHNLFSHRNMV